MRILVSSMCTPRNKPIGPPFESDTKYIMPTDLDITAVNKPRFLNRRHIERVSKAGKFDLALGACYGSHPNRLVNNGFAKLDCPKGIWYLDSHSQLGQELRSAKHFDYLFVAHSKYIPKFKQKFPNKPVIHLPCSAHKWALDDMVGSEEKKWDLFFGGNGHSPYRVRLMKEIAAKAQEAGLKVHIGPYNYDKYVPHLKKARVGLNICVRDDFNIRNFECLGSGIPLLTDRTTDHDSAKVKGIDKYCVYFNPKNLDNFIERYKKALKLSEKVRTEGIKWVKKYHSFPARMLFMINKIMNTNYRLEIK